MSLRGGCSSRRSNLPIFRRLLRRILQDAPRNGNFYDIVFCFAVLHHIPSFELRLKILKKVRALLKPEGRFIHSNWQFLTSEKLKARIQPWEACGNIKCRSRRGGLRSVSGILLSQVKILKTLNLNRCGVATSGRDHRHWRKNGLLRHHIIDPYTGQPAETNVMTATIVAPTVMEAEAAAKVCLSWAAKKD